MYCLDNNFISLDEENINVYGSTFWTNPPFASTYEARCYVNDYNYMSYFKQGLDQILDLDINYVKQLSEEAFNALNDYLLTNNKKTIIMTHFPPHKLNTSDPKYLSERQILNNYFAWPNNTLSKLETTNIITWISGHTHWSYDFCQNNVRLISNQIGYKHEVGKTGLDEDGLFEIIF